MGKTVLITGSTDGIGLESAKLLRSEGHSILLHGRNRDKLADAETVLSAIPGKGTVEGYIADFSVVTDVEELAKEVMARQSHLDVLINNAGILRSSADHTDDGIDIRFAVNLIAPYLLTKRLLRLMDASGRVINLSSAAQAPVDLEVLTGRRQVGYMASYSQSKLGLTMWSRYLARELGATGPAVIAVNPGSMLGSKMVKEGFGVAGGDIRIGAEVIAKAALSDEFASASGKYFDNDSGCFAEPHPDGLNDRKSKEMVTTIEALLARKA